METSPILIKNGKVVDVEKGVATRADVFIMEGLIRRVGAGISPSPGTRVIDAEDKYVVPGLIDGHVHVESSKLGPVEFGMRVAERGTTAAFVDPHELANVSGRKAVEVFVDAAKNLPMEMAVGVPSCVPATHLETSGAEVTLEDVRELLKLPGVYGLAEMMNFPGIIHGQGDAREKVEAALAEGKVVDGHSPGLVGKDLEAYVSAGKNDGVVRIASDHEILSLDEALEKVEKGVFVMLREGSATSNLDAILPGLLEACADMDRVAIISDDLSVGDLLTRGHMDHALRRASGIFRETLGLAEEAALCRALPLVTSNVARYFGRPDLGTVGEDSRADVVVLSDIEKVKVDTVIYSGRIVARDGKTVIKTPEYDFSAFRKPLDMGGKLSAEDFSVKAQQGKKVRVIGVIPDSLATESLTLDLPVENELVEADPENDVAMIAVFERHRGTGNRTVGFVRGLGIRKGAVASTVAHDSHNLVVAGADADSMLRAAELVAEKGGGLAVAGEEDETVLPLDLAGLMSSAPAPEVAEAYEAVKAATRKLGSELPNLFMTLSFLALPVIPALKITDRGLVDVEKFDLTGLFV